MVKRNKTINKDYWEDNIDKFSGFYDKKSEENIIAPPLLAAFYRKILFPIEKKYMRDRYNIVSDYIERNVQRGMKVADIGCGSGIFVKKMLDKGAAKVYAIDYTQSSLNLVRESLSSEELKSVELLLLDVTEGLIPKVDLAISVGVLTYIEEIETYFNNILPFTEKLLFNYLDSRNPLNVLRKLFPLLDVRRLTYHNTDVVKRNLSLRSFDILKTTKLATGFVIEAERNSQIE